MSSHLVDRADRYAKRMKKMFAEGRPKPEKPPAPQPTGDLGDAVRSANLKSQLQRLRKVKV